MKNINLISKLSVDSKSVSQLREQVRYQHKYFREKYELYIISPEHNKSKLVFLRKNANKYLEISNMLYHALYYDTLISPKKCFMCRSDDVHRQDIIKCFNSNKRIIQLCRDGRDFANKKLI